MCSVILLDVSDNESFTVEELVDSLQSVYCNKISIEAKSVNCCDEQRWLHDCFYSIVANQLDNKTKEKICKLLMDSQVSHLNCLMLLD